MGKNKKGKRVDAEKKAALQARKEAKAEKVSNKRLNMEHLGSTDTLDDMLRAYTQAHVVPKPVVQGLNGFPAPRGNASLALYEEAKKKDIYLFGGEYYDGIQNVVVDHLFKFDLTKKKWSQILTPTKPPARCAHSAVYYNHAVYIFGGEQIVGDKYYHFKDLWKFHVNDKLWTEVKAKNGPSPRSGHAAILWKSYMIVVGGFYEAAASDAPKWYNDVHVLNLKTEQWLDVPHSKLAVRPEPRSAFNVALIENSVIVHGGFSKLSAKPSPQQRIAPDGTVASETKVHTDAWRLNLLPILSDMPPSWERLTSSTGRGQIHVSNPQNRAGTASGTFKNRMIVFGGVFDKEQLNHKMDSIFYNDIFQFDPEKRKWNPILVKAVGGEGKRRRRKVKDTAESEGDDVEHHKTSKNSSGWDIEKLRSNLFAFSDGHGNIVYEKSARSRAKASAEDEKMDEDDSDVEDNVVKPLKGMGMQSVSASSVMTINAKGHPEAVVRDEPLPRINAELVISAGTLYVFGGLLEIGNREVYLDDMWSFDLQKRDKWECLWPGTMHNQVWRGSDFDDDDSYVSSGVENRSARVGKEASSRSAVDEDDSGEEKVDDNNESDSVESSEPPKSSSDLKKEIKELVTRHGISKDAKTPRPGESVDDFVQRTAGTWDQESEKDEIAATRRYQELQSILKRIQELDLERQAAKKHEKGG